MAYLHLHRGEDSGQAFGAVGAHGRTFSVDHDLAEALVRFAFPDSVKSIFEDVAHFESTVLVEAAGHYAAIPLDHTGAVDPVAEEVTAAP